MNIENEDFKDYPIVYEKVFSGERTKRACKIERVAAFNSIPGDTSVYLKIFRETAEKFQKDLFDNLVKLVWLRSRFCYDGRHRVRHRNGWIMERAYGIFMKKIRGVEQ